jgi:hypothetical protein
MRSVASARPPIAADLFPPQHRPARNLSAVLVKPLRPAHSVRFLTDHCNGASMTFRF